MRVRGRLRVPSKCPVVGIGLCRLGIALLALTDVDWPSEVVLSPKLPSPDKNTRAIAERAEAVADVSKRLGDVQRAMESDYEGRLVDQQRQADRLSWSRRRPSLMLLGSRGPACWGSCATLFPGRRILPIGRGRSGLRRSIWGWRPKETGHILIRS